LTEASTRVAENPQEFFEKLYEAHLLLLETSHFVSALGKHHGRSYAQQVSKNVSWSTNRFETTLAILLRERGLRHTRQVPVGTTGRGSLLADFLVEDRLFVELDGGFHVLAKQQLTDQRKEEHIRRMGLPLLRLPSNIMVRAPEQALKRIVEVLRLTASWPSNGAEWKPFGIST